MYMRMDTFKVCLVISIFVCLCQQTCGETTAPTPPTTPPTTPPPTTAPTTTALAPTTAGTQQKIAFGANCTNTSQCITTNADCNERCSCTNNMYHNASGDTCTDKIPFGANCTNTSQCITTNADCNEKCSCTNNMYHNANGDTCTDKIPFGANCTNTSQCITTNADCNEKCSCTNNMYHNATGDTCTDKIPFGANCTNTSQCITTNADCNQRCSCTNNMFHNATGDTCTDRQGYGKSCSSSNIECDVPQGGNSQCVSVSGGNKCLCSEGLYWSGTQCQDINTLKPSLTLSNPGQRTVHATWTAEAAVNYTSSYTLTWKSSSASPGQSPATSGQSYTIPALAPGTTYTVSISRTITEKTHGRMQNVPGDDQTETTRAPFGEVCNAPVRCDVTDTNVACTQTTEQGVNRCLCTAGTYRPSDSCVAIAPVLTPVLQDALSTETRRINVRWTNDNVTGNYSSLYMVSWTPVTSGTSGSENTTMKNHFIQPLSPGTTYTVIVTHIINGYNRNQLTASVARTYTTRKQEYGGTCSTSVPCDDARNTISCNSLVSKCLCVNGTYRNGQACVQYSTLSPRFGTPTTGTRYVYVQWSDQPASNYNDVYQLTISFDGTVRTATEKFYNFTDLQQGRNYTVSLVRTITSYGRNQSLPTVTTTTRTKVGYNQTCQEASDTCIDANTSCQGSKCRCNEGFYWDSNCVSIDSLKPTTVTVSVDSTTTMTASWVSPDNVVVTGYEVIVMPPDDIPQITVGKYTKTTSITGLTPGRQYTVSVKTIITYLQERVEKTAALSAQPKVTTPDTVGGLGDKTNLTAPDIIIDFLKADGDVQYYMVQLQGIHDVNYLQTTSVAPPATNTTFNGVVPNYQYNLTITTYSNQQQSIPYTSTIRVRASQAGTVNDFQKTSLTSRNVSMSWMRPVNTNGDLFKYRLEVFNGTCKQQIVFNCTECKRNASVEGSGNCENTIVVPISESDINNATYIVNYTITGLLPDTYYVVKVAAYNQEGRGMDSSVAVLTHEEAAGEPTAFTAKNKTSDSITLTWAPPVPRPGGTHYNISVYEKNEYTNVYDYNGTKGITGYNHYMYTVTKLSSAWEYKFYIQAFTLKGGSENVSSDVVITEESEPTKVDRYILQRIDNMYNRIKLSWECPKQKDGRNGMIKSSTLIYESNQTSIINTKRGNKTYNNTNDCKWEQEVDVTPEFNYSFTVFLHNTFPGAKSTIYEYMEPGPPEISEDSVNAPTASDSQTSVKLNICGKCLRDDKNGKVNETGLLVCVNPPCDTARKRRASNRLSYDGYTNWHDSKNGGFKEQYRTTPDKWDDGQTDKDSFEYVVGQEICEPNPDPSTPFCNGQLPEGSTLHVFPFACTRAGCALGSPVEVKTKAPIPNSTNIGMIVGAAAAAVVCVIIVVLVIWFLRRRRNTGKSERRLSTEENQIGDLIVRKRPIKISEFDKRVAVMHKDSNLLFSEEFEDIGALSPKHVCAASETGGNKLRNRYVNILPFDHTRVKLRSSGDGDEDETDYINANYIPGYNSPREYIATQGPMTGTVSDFWRMIWEQDVNIIIMLSDLLEKGKPKVDRYWPENIKEPVQYGEIIVEMINYSPLNKYVIKIFKITKGDESRKVRHYFLPGWQDFGANLTPDDVISFVRDVRMTIKPTDKGPICVHCSAGVGRTGTYVSLDVFKQAIDEENFDKELDVFDFVMKMRENRSYMVQTEKQYIFIHDTINEMIIRKKKEIAERDNIYQNSDLKPEENIYANQAYEPDPEELYMNVKPGQPTTVL